jgi:DeoR/GlpR family transcriptional regulator of sugar metabolism
VIYPRLGVLVGPLAVESFSKIHCDIAVMSAGGVSMEGITNSHGLLVDIQRAMIKGAQKVIFCFDHTKLGRKSVLPLCDLDCVDTIVTDAGANPEIVEALQSHNIEVIIASTEAKT